MKLAFPKSRKYIRLLWCTAIIIILIVGYYIFYTYKRGQPLQSNTIVPSNCTFQQKPQGSSSDQPFPIWCYSKLSSATTTLRAQAAMLIDDFNDNRSFSDCCRDYSIFKDSRAVGTATFWKHRNQLLMDSDGGSAMIRTKKSLQLAEGALSVDFEAATNMPGYNDRIMHEIILSSAQKPTDNFAKQEYIRCTIQGATTSISCTTRTLNNPDQKTIDLAPLSAAQRSAWKTCKDGEPAANCMNRFRLELTNNTIKIQVNGINMPLRNATIQLPPSFKDGAFFAYFSSVNRNKAGTTYRFYWDNFAINAPVSKSAVLGASTTQIATNEASIQFNGRGFARIPHAKSYNARSGWTIEAWFKDESRDGKAGQGYNHPTRYLLTKGDTDTTENIPYILGIEENKIFVGTQYDFQPKTVTFDLQQSKLTFNEWHHVAATLDPATNEITLYINGLPVVTSQLVDYTVKDNTQPLFIGKNGDSNHWIGKIDDVRIWDKPRTAAQIRENYDNELVKKQPNLVGNWKFNEGKGKIAIDFSARGEHMMIIEGKWSLDLPTN